MALMLTALLGGLRSAAPFDDFLYPSAEAREMAGLTPPAACANASGWAVVFAPPSDAAPGGPPCVLERSFEQWGVMAQRGVRAQRSVARAQAAGPALVPRSRTSCRRSTRTRSRGARSRPAATRRP